MIAASRPVPAQRVARHYDEVDPFYRALWGEHVHHGLWTTGRESTEEAVEALLVAVAERARIGPGSRVCDVGCGYGATGRWLARRHGARVTGITVSAVQQRRARARGDDVRLGDWLTCDVADAAFDAVLAVESLSHMADIPAALARAHRALRPGGRFVACVWLASEAPSAFDRRALLDPIVEEGRLAGLPTLVDYRAWLPAAGFLDVVATDVSARVARTWRVVAARAAGALARPSSWRYLLDAAHSERRFAVTVVRMAAAFRRGCLRYAILEGGRAAGSGGD